MPVIWAAISGHGYGHAAQTVPVLNELGKLIPDLRAVLRTTVPDSFFRDRLTIPWDVSVAKQDIGCVQHGPLRIDVDATWLEHERFHADWEMRLAHEAAALRRADPALVLANTPYLSIEAAANAGIQAVALANLTWDSILEEFLQSRDEAREGLIESIRRAYSHADLALRIAPGLPMKAFGTVLDVAPIACPVRPDREGVRRAIHACDDERIVLVGFGGIRQDIFPWDRMEAMEGYRFLLDGPIEPRRERIHSLDDLPYRFGTILASADLILTKPGYATIIEAVSLGVPVVYVRRYTFADENPILSYLHRYGRGQELSAADFTAGDWGTAFERALRQPSPPSSPPSPAGHRQAAESLVRYFRR